MFPLKRKGIALNTADQSFYHIWALNRRTALAGVFHSVFTLDIFNEWERYSYDDDAK